MKKRHLTAAGLIMLSLLLPLGLQAQAASLDVPYYAQGGDSPWADEKLGNKSELTIRTHGCALTCISMVTSHFSREEITPQVMNSWLKKHSGYKDGWNGDSYLGEVSLNWPALAGFGGGWVYTRFDWKALPADLTLIRYYLDKKVPVIAEVLYKNAPHYIVLTGYNEEGFTMNDPEFPEKHKLGEVYNIADKWGSGASRNIYGIRVLYPGTLN